MKRLVLLALVISLFASFAFVRNSEKKVMPSVILQTMDGEAFDTKDFRQENGDPVYISFWALWRTSRIWDLDVISEVYDEWQEETGVKIYAVSIDDDRNTFKVRPFVTSQGWKYEVVLDMKSKLKDTLCVNHPPHSFVLNGKGEIVWEFTDFHPGDEEKIVEVLRKVKAGEL